MSLERSGEELSLNIISNAIDHILQESLVPSHMVLAVSIEFLCPKCGRKIKYIGSYIDN